jgi:hypothetical protein
MDDLEEMMMMEAIRLSLASEEERRKREEKELRKEAKRREKEAKKAEKMARKAGLYSNNASSSALESPSDSRLPKVTSSSSSIIGEETAPPGKGKAVERVTPSQSNVDLTETASFGDVPSSFLEPQQPHSSSSLGPPVPREPSKPSHLRHVSSASSSISSLVESMSEEPGVSSQPHEGTSSSAEPLFNFRSLAAVIGDEDKPDEAAEHVEDTAPHTTSEGSTMSAANLTTAPAGESAVSTSSTAVEKGPRVEESQERSVHKEIEARSMEVTDSRNSETTS